MERTSRVVFWGVLLFFYVPILILMVNSFNVSRFGGTWKGFTLKWYTMLFRDRVIWRAFMNTVKIALASTAISTVLGTTAALALHKWKGKFQTFHYGLIYTHLVLPDILMGISLMLFFIAVGLGQSIFTIILAHTTFCLSYVAMSVLGTLQDFDDSLIEAAKDLGANTWVTFWKVQFPLILPGIIAGGLLAFTLSIDDFVITFFVAGPGSGTLPVEIYGMIKRSPNIPMINALSTILLVGTALAVIVSRMLQKKGK
ncbi:MAG: ABC transporter permease [Lentisphaerae bacterium]|nr:ABC transporter permease [Lentisphaerota bacterium]